MCERWAAVGDIADGPDEDLQMLLLEFLSGLTGDPSTADLFYPADLNVLLDTVLREVGNLPLGELHVRGRSTAVKRAVGR
mgnify:CR=1 FL=1